MSLSETRDLITLAYADNMINDEEFLFLDDINSSKNPDFPYWSYEKFDFETLTIADCWVDLRFRKPDIPHLQEVLRIPEVVRTYNRLRVDGLEALCIFLKRYSAPNRYLDMVRMFPQLIGELSIISRQILDHIHTEFGHLLNEFNPALNALLQPNKLETYCQAISDKGAALNNCFGFVDGTVRPICRPGKNQRTVYN